MYSTTSVLCSLLFFFNDTATTEIYTLSLHDALPISHLTTSSPHIPGSSSRSSPSACGSQPARSSLWNHLPFLVCHIPPVDRKSTRLNSSHANISYAVFCLKKKTITTLLYRLLHID